MNFTTLDLNLLKVLDALFQEGSTVRAADRLGLSQPAVSNALSRLRHALDDPLFIRQGNKLVATSYAQSLEHDLRAELGRIREILAPPAAFDPATARGTFMISGSDFFAEMLMPSLAALFLEQAQGIRVQLIDLSPGIVIERPDAADLALVTARELPEWMNHEPLFRSSFVVISREENPHTRGLRDGDVMPLETFCTQPHVLFSPDGDVVSLGDEALARIGRARTVAMTVPIFSGVCRAVSESDLIALAPMALARKLAPSLGLRSFQPPIPVDEVLIIGMWHRRLDKDPQSRWARDRVFDQVRTYS